MGMLNKLKSMAADALRDPAKRAQIERFAKEQLRKRQQGKK